MGNSNKEKADTLSDMEIITRVLEGEKELYALIVRRYNQRLYKIGMSIINDDSEVEDVMQVSYIKAYENLRQFKSRSLFSTWLTRILINESLSRVKQKKKNLPVSEENIVEDLYSNKTQTPYMKLLDKELRGVLEKAILKLPEKYRTVFIMRELENMNVTETTDCLKITEANVKVRLNRARIMLRELISKHYKNEELLQFHLSRCDRMVQNVMKEIQNRY